MKETLLGGSWKGLIALETCFEGTDCRMSASAWAHCSLLAPSSEATLKLERDVNAAAFPHFPGGRLE